MDQVFSTKIRQIVFFSILCVVVVHSMTLDRTMAGHSISYEQAPATYYVEHLVSEGFARVGLPSFFIISGYLLFLSMRRFDSIRSYYSYAVKKRVRSLILPFLIWSVFWIIVYIVIESLPFIQPYLNSNKIS